MTPDQEIARGREAALVTGNVTYKEAMLKMRAKLMDLFQQTTYDQSSERDEIWRKMQTIDWFEEELNTVMTTGRMREATNHPNSH